MATKIEIQQHLKTLVDPSYQQFQAKLVPGSRTLLGVRIPLLRAYAKEIKETDPLVLLEEPIGSVEEVLLAGLLLGMSSKNIHQKLEDLDRILSYFENWEETDLVASSLKFLKKEPVEGLELITNCLHSSDPYQVRFGLVLLLTYYLDEDHLPFIFDVLDQLSSDHYYVRMAAAWLLSYCYIRYPDQTCVYFDQTKLDRWTLQKALQKCLDSKQITPEQKAWLRAKKREPFS